VRKPFKKFFIWIGECLETFLAVEKSPLRHLGFHESHTAFQMLGIMWAIIFGWITGSFFAFGAGVVIHFLIVGGIFITCIVFRHARKQQEAMNKAARNTRKKLRHVDHPKDKN